MTDIKWPDGATHKIDGDYTKWMDGVEYNLDEGHWVKNLGSWSLDEYRLDGDFKVIDRPIDAPYMPKVGEWCDYRTVQKGEYRKAFFIGYNEVGEHVLKDVHGDFIEDNCNFRPIKTEREQFIEQAEAMRESGDEYHDLLSRMHDSGARFK
tara:strand:- start:87 stop:539 length:453 start_codon:yes stop_codon:yes gene_type:complete